MQHFAVFVLVLLPGVLSVHPFSAQEPRVQLQGKVGPITPSTGRSSTSGGKVGPVTRSTGRSSTSEKEKALAVGAAPSRARSVYRSLSHVNVVNFPRGYYRIPVNVISMSGMVMLPKAPQQDAHIQLGLEMRKKTLGTRLVCLDIVFIFKVQARRWMIQTLYKDSSKILRLREGDLPANIMAGPDGTLPVSFNLSRVEQNVACRDSRGQCDGYSIMVSAATTSRAMYSLWFTPYVPAGTRWDNTHLIFESASRTYATPVDLSSLRVELDGSGVRGRQWCARQYFTVRSYRPTDVSVKTFKMENRAKKATPAHGNAVTPEACLMTNVMVQYDRPNTKVKRATADEGEEDDMQQSGGLMASSSPNSSSSSSATVALGLGLAVVGIVVAAAAGYVYYVRRQRVRDGVKHSRLNERSTSSREGTRVASTRSHNSLKPTGSRLAEC